MRVYIFNSVKSAGPRTEELDKIVSLMQSSQEIRLRTILHRKFIESGDDSSAEQIKISKIPAFAPCVFFDGRIGRKYVLGLTDICYLDFDDIKEESKLIDAMNTLRNDKNVLLASRSISNEGLHILIRYKLKDMEIPSEGSLMTPMEIQEVYGKVCNFFMAKYQNEIGMTADSHSINMDRLYIMSYDPDLYYNPDAEPLEVDLNNTLEELIM